MSKLVPVMIGLLLFACSSEESVEDYNKKQAKAIDSKKPKQAAVKIKTAVKGGTRIACEKLFNVEQMTTLMAEELPISFQDHTDKEDMTATAVCSVRRGGEVMDQKKQQEIAKKTMKLGVLAGDELCNVGVYCAIPANEKQLKDKCKKDMEKGNWKDNEAIGVYSCVRITPKGPNDSFTYRFIDSDSRCVMSVRGGPSVNEETEVQKCAKAAADLLTPESLK